ADYLEDELNESVVVTNIEGASGVIGGEEVLNAEPDGYKVLIDDDPTMTLAELNGDRDYGVFDFEPIASITSSPELIGVNSKHDWEDLEDVVEEAKSNPGELNFGATAGTFSELLPFVIQDEKDIDFNITMYDGSSDRNKGLISGEIDLGMISLSESEEYIDSGDLKLITSLSEEKEDNSDDSPDVPTLKEQGVDFEHASSRGIFAPKDTPEDIVQRLSDALKEVSENEEFQESIEKAGSLVEYVESDEYKESLEEERDNIKNITEDM